MGLIRMDESTKPHHCYLLKKHYSPIWCNAFQYPLADLLFQLIKRRTELNSASPFKFMSLPNLLLQQVNRHDTDLAASMHLFRCYSGHSCSVSCGQVGIY